MSTPIEKRQSARITPRAIQGWLRLFLIELRRSPAIIAAILIALTTWWLMRGGLRVGVVYWQAINDVAADPMIPVSGITAGVAAYIAGRDRRSHIEEQIHATSACRLSRDLAAALSILVWCLLGYIVVVAGYFAYAENGATWGGPAWGVISIVVASITASMALGWFVGSLIRNRLSPLVAFGLMIFLHALYPLTDQFRVTRTVLPSGIVTYHHGADSWRLLAPGEMLDFSALLGVIMFGTLWLAGLATLFWFLSAWWRYRGGAAGVSAMLALVVTMGSASALVSGEWQNPAPEYVEPVCTARLDGQISVCVLPKSTALLDEVADSVAELLSPLAGITELPARYEEMQRERVDDGTVYFSLYDQTTITHLHLQQSVLSGMFVDPSGFTGRIGSAQYVIGAWLLQDAGISLEELGNGPLLMPLRIVYSMDADIRAGITDPAKWGQQNASPAELAAYEVDIHAAIDRFSALPPDQQRAWLEANWDALRAGELTLEDLPW